MLLKSACNVQTVDAKMGQKRRSQTLTSQCTSLKTAIVTHLMVESRLGYEVDTMFASGQQSHLCKSE